MRNLFPVIMESSLGKLKIRIEALQSIAGLIFFFSLTAHKGVQDLPFAVTQSHYFRGLHVVIDEQQIECLGFAVRPDQFFTALSTSS